MTRLLASLPSTFLGFIALGVGVILTFSAWSAGGPGGSRHWTMTALVVGLMFVYGLLLWLRSRTAYAAETDGETFYYLGFIYTLATLVATFAPLLNSPERVESRHVLGLFGVGLITTFVGLAGRIVFAQTVAGPARPEDDARRLADAYTDAARAIERSTVRIVHAQQRAEGHLNESYAGAVETLRNVSDRATQQLEALSAQVLQQFATMIERVSAGAESAFAEMRTRAALQIDAASREATTTHDTAKAQIESLAAGTASAVREFLSTTLQQFETRLGALRLPPEDVSEKLTVVLTELAERAERLRRATVSVEGAYGELEETLAGAVNGARDGGRAFSALAVSADAATSAVTSARTNVEQFAAHLTELAAVAAALEKLPQEGAGIIATLGDLRTHLGEANRAWAEVAGVTDDASKSMARAEAALSSLEHGTRAADQSVRTWSGGLTNAGLGLHALTEVTERVVKLGQDAVTTQAQLSAQISGPLIEQLRLHSEAAGALASRLQEDLQASEEAVRRVHHHLIDASRFILSKVEYRR